MDHKQFTNITKAMLHCYNTVQSFYSEISIIYPHYSGLYYINIYRDTYDAILEIYMDSSSSESNKVLKIKLTDFVATMGKPQDVTYAEDSFCYTNTWFKNNNDLGVITLNPDSIKVYHRAFNAPTLYIENLEEQHFQESTVRDIFPIEQFYYMRDMYAHFSTFIPRGVGVHIRYTESVENKDFVLDNDFIEFMTQKVWGIIALA